ncbi:DUF1934 domain-containing protein [Lactococcus sp.]|uniref:DUF1934 domain-containing protein n=1 Tax=Lactococcus sp. TaxID=44273 RepID=UPI0035B297FE
MVTITITNEIRIGAEKEVIHEVFSGQQHERAGKTVLIYKNQDDEKVMIKFDKNELSMTRYGAYPTTMKFKPSIAIPVNYEGLGALSVMTELLAIDDMNQALTLNYQIAQNEMKVGDYKMRVSWRED